MPLNKVQLEYVAGTPADADAVAAYLRTSTNALTSIALLTGTVEALDVRAFTSDAAGVGITSTLVTGKQSLDVNVTAIASGTMFDVEGNVADGVADGTSKPVKIGWQAVQALPAAATSGQRVNGIADLYRRGYVNTSPNIAVRTTQASVAATAALLVATALPGRQRIAIQNDSSKAIYIGPTGVTTSGTTIGIRIPGNGGYYEDLWGDNIPIYAIGVSAGPFLITVMEKA